MKIKQLIKKSISQKTLFTDVFGYSLTKTGFADKYLAGQLTMYKSYSWLKKHFENDLKQIKAELPKEQNCEAAEKQVWICWLQGMENAPQIVQDCYASVCYWMKDWKITVITADNMNEYVQFPDYIVRKWKEGVISNTHLSDLLRLELLIRYGGLWIDSTTYMTGTIPAYIDDSNFFVYRNGWMDMEMINMGSWLIFSKYTNNIILLETQSLLSGYFRQNQESACGKAEARRFCGKFCNLWIPEGPQQSYQTNRGRTGSGNSAEHLSLEDQWHEQSGHRKSFECEKGTVPSCTKVAERCKAEPAFP